MLTEIESVCIALCVDRNRICMRSNCVGEEAGEK